VALPMTGPSPILEIARVRDARSGRVSSWDQRGRNQDAWIIGPGETRALADLEGPGTVTHLWLTQYCRRVLGPGHLDPLDTAGAAPVLEIHNALGLNWEAADPDYYRKVLFRVTYDDGPEPAILVPLGDFFGVGHSMPASYASAFFTVSAKPEESLVFGGSASLNCYLPMPFRERILIEVINENDIAYGQYFHVDYELYRQPLLDDIAYLHASWRRSDPCPGWGPDLQTNSPETNVPNLTDEHNYLVLATEGRGQYLGCNLSVFHRQGSWWGEGDDMIMIDDDTWPPSLHGTGTEDYFNHAWGMQARAYPWHGAIVHEGDVPGYSVSYRFHGPDPIRFSERIRVSIEHGHANHLADDWSSTAYWYQLPPSPPAHILPMVDRLPTRPGTGPRPTPTAAPPGLRDEALAAREAAASRDATYRERYDERTRQRVERTVREEAANREQAQDLRRRFR
jgi:Protein of unknown function (DUF2961)